METAIINGICRCCASEGAFKDIRSAYQWMGAEEIYADMLKECFDLSLWSSGEGDDGGICEVCVTQLRNASNFKKQVLHTEEQFKKHLHTRLFKPSIVKVELPANDGIDSDDNISAEEGYSGTDYEVSAIKVESPEESKPKKRSAKMSTRASTSRAKKAKGDAGESSTKHLRSRDRSPLSEEEEEKTLKLDRKLNFSSFVSIRPVGKKVQPMSRSHQKKISEQKRLSELDWQFDNIKTILKCSNAVPLRCRVGDRFACSYCLDQFENPSEIRTHSLRKHKYDKPDFYNARSLYKYIVYLDITGLKCNICDEEMETLHCLMDHLKSDHDELIHRKIKCQIVPYKVSESDVLCGVCSSDIGQFEDMQDHMCEHFRNYVCGFCDRGFVIKGKLLEHKKTVHMV